jgi:type IX secretion system PorP/SprF family membrane protein
MRIKKDHMKIMQNYNQKNLIILLLSVVAIIVSTGNASAQQSFTYSQYMNNLTPINSAYTLIEKNGSLNALLRKQWAGIEGAPTTFIFDGSLPIESLGASVGAIVVDDKFAVEHLTEVNAFFAKGVQLNEKQFLGISLNAGFRRYVANYSSLDPNDPSFMEDIRQNKINVGFGVMFYSDNYYIGLSAPKLTFTSLGNASNTTNTYYKNIYNLAGAYLLNAGTDMKIKPAFLASYAKDIPIIADISTTLYLKSTVGVGVNYRTNHEISGIVSIITNSFRLGYSYQFGAASNTISQFNNTTHEVTFGYRFGKNLGKKLL